MTAPTTFERVYDGLKDRLQAGRFAPGDHLEPAVLASELNASITPVRDALQRLVGERLAEASPGGGFRLPVLTEVGLRQLYWWNNELLQLAIRTAGKGPLPPTLESPGEDGGVEIAVRAQAICQAIAQRSGSAELSAAVMSLGDRLAAVRRKESSLLDGGENELAELSARLTAGDLAKLRPLLSAYHRRRIRIVDRLVASLQGSA